MKTIEVCCVVLPDSTTLWIPNADDGQDKVRDSIQRWQDAHPAYTGIGCTIGCVIVTMSEDAYNALPASQWVAS